MWYNWRKMANIIKYQFEKLAMQVVWLAALSAHFQSTWTQASSYSWERLPRHLAVAPASLLRPASGQVDLFSSSYFPGVLPSSPPSEHTRGPGKQTCKGVLALQCYSWWIWWKDFLNKHLPQINFSPLMHCLTPASTTLPCSAAVLWLPYCCCSHCLFTTNAKLQYW